MLTNHIAFPAPLPGITPQHLAQLAQWCDGPAGRAGWRIGEGANGELAWKAEDGTECVTLERGAAWHPEVFIVARRGAQWELTGPELDTSQHQGLSAALRMIHAAESAAA